MKSERKEGSVGIEEMEKDTGRNLVDWRKLCYILFLVLVKCCGYAKRCDYEADRKIRKIYPSLRDNIGTFCIAKGCDKF